MRRRVDTKRTRTQAALEDLTVLLAGVEMPALTRHWVEEHLRTLDLDMGGAISREEADELIWEIEDLRDRARDLVW